jgi:hypothetical protein
VREWESKREREREGEYEKEQEYNDRKMWEENEYKKRYTFWAALNARTGSEVPIWNTFPNHT